MPRHRQTITQAQQNELLNGYNQSQNGRLRTRYQALRLYSLGYGVAEIVEITGGSVTSLNRWWQIYQNEGVGGLCDDRIGGNSAHLTAAQITELTAKLATYSPAQVFGLRVITGDGQFWSVADLRQGVTQWYGVTYRSTTSYATLFNRCGFSYQRTEKVYRSRAEAKVAEFEEMLEKKR